MGTGGRLGPVPLSHRTVVRQTLRALLEPKRAGPVLLVGVALVIAETVYDQSYRAGAVASTMALATAAAAPCGWRLWLEAPRSTWDRVWGAIAYVGGAFLVRNRRHYPRLAARVPFLRTSKHTPSPA